MKTIRNGVFETNSSSTHSISVGQPEEGFLPPTDYVLIDFIDTNDEYSLSTLREKVSYLVSHIVNKYKWDSEDYEELVENVRNSYDFQRIEAFVRNTYHKEIRFPKKYNGDLEDIVEINHQLVENSLDDVLYDLIRGEKDILEEVLRNGNTIIFGRD